MKTRYIFWLAVMAALPGCEDINKGGEPNYLLDVAVTFKSEIAAYDTTQDEAWEGGENIGLFMKKNQANLDAENIVNGVGNRRLIAADDGTMSVPEDEQDIMYQSDASKVDFILYAPWSEKLSNNALTIEVGDQSATEKYDFLYSNNATGKYKSMSPVKTVFKHIPAKITMSVTNGEGITEEDLAALRIVCHGMYATGSFSLETGTIAYTGDVTPITVNVADNGRTAECVLLPTVEVPVLGRMLKFTVNNIEHIHRFTEDFLLEMGKQYVLDVKVSVPGIDVTIREIKDWTVEDESGEAIL